MKTVSAPIQIGAPPMTVWKVLTDLGRYHEWNPLIREASGEIVVGKRIRLLSVQPATGRMMTVKPKIIAVEPGVELRWISSLLGLIGGEHRFALSPAEGGTRLVQSERFWGPLVSVSGKTFTSAEASYRAFNEALKKRVEAAEG